MKKYKHRVNEREFLNLPGHHDGAYISAYVEDTSERTLERSDYGRKDWYNPSPRIILEIADCSNRVNLEFELDKGTRRENAFHKIDTLIESLQNFRAGLVEESTLYKRREKVMRAIKDEGSKEDTKTAESEDESPMSAEDFLRYLEGMT